jgi:hypothetical protein
MKIYSSPASIIEYVAIQNLLKATWTVDAKSLTEDEVKHEINNVLSFAKEFHVKNIIVDSRLYPFRNNLDIQLWINHQFMPMIIEIGVKKYAILVNEQMDNQVSSLYDEDEDLQVEYFTDPMEAQRWIAS